tara:strand:- start:2032 stop:2391 length:360 start_codon:yes stop_codon:yes gene_type:complete
MFRTQIKASIIKENEERSPEFVLWQAVIAQAITDAKYDGIRKNYLDCKRLAIAWFSNCSKDFKEVCQYANIDPDYAYKKTQLAMEKGLFKFTSEQSKILEDKRTPAQIKYEKKGFKLKF